MTLSPESERSAEVRRTTAETDITVRIHLDGTGQHKLATGVGFLDHMLAQLACHSLVDIEVQARGDLHIDAHHTVEDCALALGSAFRQALGARTGIQRMASAWVPMDEALAFVALDFSGRGVAVIEAEFSAPSLGSLPTSLIAHFLDSFAREAGVNLHARICAGRDDHHKAEALFKALARAVREAVQPDPRRAGIPSTKGSLQP